MASLNEIAIAFADSVDKGFDIQFVERIKFSVKYWRAKLIRQEVERTPLNQSIVQSFLTTLTDVDELDSCVITSGCIIKRTASKVPKPIHIKGSDPFQYVGPASIKCAEDIPFAYSPLAEIANSQFNNWTNAVVRYNYMNNYIYVYGDCLRKYIRITHVFEDPKNAVSLCNNSINCISDDDDFPIGIHMLDTILMGLRSGEMDVKTKNREVLIEPEI